jgi:hypothetical protein
MRMELECSVLMRNFTQIHYFGCLDVRNWTLNKCILPVKVQNEPLNKDSAVAECVDIVKIIGSIKIAIY